LPKTNGFSFLAALMSGDSKTVAEGEKGERDGSQQQE
jgi:hypothetical protein